MKLEIWCGWAHPYKTIAKLIVHSIVTGILVSTDWQFEMFKRGKANGHDTCLVYISKYVSLISVANVDGTHWNCLNEAIPMCTYNICTFNK